MNEQTLTSLIGAMFITPISGNLELKRLSRSDVQNIVDLAKAYADAQVAEIDKDAQTLANALLRVVPEGQLKILDKDTEIAELKAQIRNHELRIDSNSEELDRRYAERSLLIAEIKRLRDFANQCHKLPEKLVVIHYFENGEFDYCDLVPLQDAAVSALSPAPITETQNEDQP